MKKISKKKTNKNSILGFDVSSLFGEKLLNEISKKIESKDQTIIYNINPLIVLNFYKDKKMVEEFNSQKFNIPDGIGVVMMMRLKGSDVKKRIAGIDLFYDICKILEEKKLKVFIYGTKKEILDSAVKNLKKSYKNIKIVGTINGYEKEEKVLEDIKNSKPDVLFVATGSPKQENFIFKNKSELKEIKLIMPIGGVLDVVSGKIKRAPKIIIKLHLEWFYRMIIEPKRIIRNLGLIKFVFLVISKDICYNRIEESKYD